MASRLKETGRRVKERLTNTPRAIANPAFLEDKLEDATTLGQWLAAFFLAILIPICLMLFRALHGVMVLLLLGLSGTVGQTEGVPFLVTGLTFAALISMIWFWFQWVRTAGFGYLNVRIGGDA